LIQSFQEEQKLTIQLLGMARLLHSMDRAYNFCFNGKERGSLIQEHLKMLF
jgi:hypothetical protein